MKKLVFKNGTKLFFDDSSIKYCIVMICNKFSDLDDVAKEFSAENLDGAKFEDEELQNIVPDSIRVQKLLSEKRIVATFNLRKKTDEEIMKEKIRELDELIAKLKGQS